MLDCRKNLAVVLAVFVTFILSTPLYSVLYLNSIRTGTYNYTNAAISTYSPPGFVMMSTNGRRANLFKIWDTSLAPATSWSGGKSVVNWQSTNNLARNDQGTTNYATMTAPFPNANIFITVVCSNSISTTSEMFGTFYTTTVPRYITVSSNNLLKTYADPLSNVVVFATFSGAKATEQSLVIRWTTNDWTNSGLSIGVNYAGNNYSNSIPAMPSGTLVKYYVLTTAGTATNLLTGNFHDYTTIYCLSNETSPYRYYVAGTWHTVAVDGTNYFNTNAVERFPTTTTGYTNWLTWDSNFVYMGFYGADIGSGTASKVLHVYFGTNTNTNNTTGWAYGYPEGTRQMVLPFRANYLFRYSMDDVRNTYVWTNLGWSNFNSPLTTGTSNVRVGNYLEFRIHRTNFQNSTTRNLSNLIVLSCMVDTSSGQVYAACPSNTLVDGVSANPSNFIMLRREVWMSNQIPSSNINFTNDINAPHTNAILGPANNQTNVSGDVIILSNFSMDMAGVYRIDYFTNGGFLTNQFVSNTNAVYGMQFTTAGFVSGIYYFTSVARDTKNSNVSVTTNTNVFMPSGYVYLPGTWDGFSEFSTPFTNAFMPPGFVRRTVTANLNNYFLIHNAGWDSNHAWSYGYNMNLTNVVTNISRNDQGAWPANTNWARLTAWPATSRQLTVVSTENPSNATEKFGFMMTATTPVWIVASSNNIANTYANANSNVTVFITISSNGKDPVERILVHYTTNEWTNSMIVTASQVLNSNFTAVIPAMGSGLTVKYYVLNTTMNDVFLTNGNDEFGELACYSNESSPFVYYTAGSLHTIAIDGVNDFNTNDAELYLTTTAGYTNWVTWDSNYLYLGFFGTDIGAGDPDTMLYVYLSTNTNRVTNQNMITGSAYGESQANQKPVLPFQANYFVQYLTTGSVTSGVWTNGSWNTSVSSLTPGISFSVSGNYLEMRIGRTNFMNLTSGSFSNLNMVSFMLNKASGSEMVYSAMPQGSLIDGFNQAPRSFLFFRTNMWVSNLVPSDPVYESSDTIPPYTNTLLWPTNNQPVDLGTVISLSNFARDENGIYYVEVYTNIGALYDYFWVTNTNAIYSYDIPTTNFNAGTYNFYTLAYDTGNTVSSQTNTNVTLRIRSDMSIYKSISSIVLPNINELFPGALIIYQLVYTNAGPHSATNVVIYDKIPDHTAYYTNYDGTATGWTAEYAHIANPDQSYGSADYDSTPVNVIWFRWKKQSIATNESGSTMFLGVTVD